MLALLFAIELGVLPYHHFWLYDLSDELYDDFIKTSFYTDLEVSLMYRDRLYIGGGLKTTMEKNKFKTKFWPNELFFDFEIGYKGENLQFGLRHFCYHPVILFLPVYYVSSRWEGAYEELFVRISARKVIME